jgi:hypothetical protein
VGRRVGMQLGRWAGEADRGMGRQFRQGRQASNFFMIMIICLLHPSPPPAPSRVHHPAVLLTSRFLL